MAVDLREQLQASLGSAYHVERELGGGGMSRVFLAEERRLGRRVVVKVLSPELAADVSAERFEREIRVAARLQDPRIVPVLSAGDAGGIPFYTMPFVDGASLRARIGDGAIPVASAISILRDIALALEHAHAQGIVHRDIKPENVLLTAVTTPAGDAASTVRSGVRVGTAMVTDFGIAKAILRARDTGRRTTDGLPPHGAPSLTGLGTTLGTPAYMAPEQAAGDEHLDHRADLYAWGVVAYELLTGSHPFADRPSAAALITAHMRDMPRPLAERRPGLSRALVDVVHRALAKDPAGRPASAADLVRALDEAASGGGRRPTTGRVRWIATAVAGAVVMGAGALVLARRSRASDGSSATPSTDVRSVAVMPFVNRSLDSADVYFAEGMSDELATALGTVSSLRVASRSAAARLRDRGATDVARVLHVDAVLEGSVRRAGQRLRISAALTNGASGIEMWSNTFEREAKDVFDVQDEIARAIVTSLRVALAGPSSGVSAALRGTDDLEAYNLYLRGRYAWSRRGREGLLSAVALYGQAIARDSAFARAYAGQAMAYTPMPVFGVARADSVLPLAERAARRALALDSTLAEAHLALANVLKMKWQWAEAERHFRAAVELAPSDATAHQWFGTYLYSLGHVDSAATQLLVARDLDPVSPVLGTDVTYGLYAARRFRDALDEAKRTVALDTTLAISHWLTGVALLANGRPDSALVAFETARTLGPAPDARPELVHTYLALGRRADAAAAYASFSDSYGRGEGSGLDMAVAAVAVGDMNAALAAVKRSIERREALVTEYSVPCDPLLDPLKARPEFTRLLESVGMRVCPAVPR